MFKSGEKVICIEPYFTLAKNQTYTVKKMEFRDYAITSRIYFVHLLEQDAGNGHYATRFISAEGLTELERVIYDIKDN